MNALRRLLSLLLVLSFLFTSGIGQALATSCRTQEETGPVRYSTGPLVDVSDMFVMSDAEPETEQESMAAPRSVEVVSVETTPIYAAPAVTGESQFFTYKVLADNSCSVTGYTGGACAALEIPEQLDGYPVSAIDNNAFKGIAVESVILPGGVTAIGRYAFQNCTALKSVELGTGLTSIGAYAFKGCTSLSQIVLPDTVESMGAGVFQNCSALTSVTYPTGLKKVDSGISVGVFTGCTALETIIVPEGVTALPTNVFGFAESLKSVKLPTTLTSIGNNAFQNSGIVSIDLPDGVTSIGSYAFQNCTALKSAELGTGLTSIGAFAFGGCTGLSEIVLPDTVESMGNGVFQNCTELASFTYPAGLKTADAGVSAGIFTGCTALETIIVPEGVTALPTNVFSFAESLKSVKLPTTLTSIGNNAFQNSGIVSVDLPDGVISIGSYAFENCSALKSIELGSSLTSIGAYAFKGCTGLSQIVLPDTVETIRSCAFYNCTNLASFTYPKSLKNVESSLWSGVFSGCTALEIIVIPEGVTELPANVFCYAESLKSVKLPKTLQSIGDCAFQNSGIVSVDLPDGAVSIGDYAFENCAALQSVKLGSSLTSIGAFAFKGCTGLSEIVLPDTVESINTGAFQNCASLESFTYPAGLKEANAGVSVGVFTGCTALETIEVPEGVTAIPANIFCFAESLKSVKLPATLTSIGYQAFRNSGIVSVDLPDGVTLIGDAAFQNCTALKSIQMGTSLTSLGMYAFCGCTGLTGIDLPETVETIGSNAFSDCVGLTAMELPDALKTLGYAAFLNCTALESVIFCDGVSELQGQVFYGCSALHSIHLPRALKRIQHNAFTNCTALTEIYIPDSVILIMDNAFAGIPGITFRCDVISYAAEFALDHRIPMIPTRIGDGEISSPLNTENSYYIHNYDGLSAAGVMSMVAHYEMQENAGVTPSAITIHIYDFAALQENTLTLDGVLCTNYEYDEETGRLTVPVEASSGTLRFCMKPLRYEALTSYARLICTDSNGKTSMAHIGAVNSLMPALNITVKEETAASSVRVSGLAVPESEVSLYLDGAFVKKVKANKVGDYSAVISLGNPVEGKQYTITAEAADRNGNLVAAQADVVYRYDAPELVDFVMIYDNHMAKRISLMEVQGTRPVLYFNPQMPFRFEMDFTNPDVLSNVYVVSTRNNVKKYLKAYWDRDLGLFVAEGFFDPQDHSYVPGVLSLDYTCGGERISFAQEVDFSSQEAYDALPQVWKDAQIEVVENTEERTVMNVTVGYGEDRISFEMSNNTQSIPTYITKENISDYGFVEITDDYGGSLYMMEEGSTITIVDFVTGQITNITIDRVLDFMGNAIDDVAGASGVSGLLSIVSSVNDYYKTESKFDILQQAYQNDDSKSASEKKHFNDQVDAARHVNAMTTIVGCTYTAVSFAVGIVYPPAGAVLFVSGVASGILIAGIRAYVNNDMVDTVCGVQARFKWVIDPSGYVYDRVTGDRLSGVTVRAYWIENTEDDPAFFDKKPGADEYGTLWDSAEYSQQNPLITDAEGCYAWDVPEGWWRVSYEKEGYESTWSEWLPVPPPQLEVNIGMMPIGGEHHHTEEIIPAEDATCTQTGLSEGKRCAVCNEVLVKQEIVPAKGHRWSAATCSAAKTCSICNVTEGEPAAHVYDNHVDGTCNVCAVSRETVEVRQVVHMFRMYNPNTGEHFYTGSEEERDNLIGHGWQYEGVGFTFPANTGAPVYRLFHEPTGEHLYTMDETEKNNLVAEGWNYEGIAFNSAYDTEAVQHRLHNPNATVGAYHFTFSEEEKQNLINAGWEYQGIGWYSCWK